MSVPVRLAFAVGVAASLAAAIVSAGAQQLRNTVASLALTDQMALRYQSGEDLGNLLLAPEKKDR